MKRIIQKYWYSFLLVVIIPKYWLPEWYYIIIIAILLLTLAVEVHTNQNDYMSNRIKGLEDANADLEKQVDRLQTLRSNELLSCEQEINQLTKLIKKGVVI